MAKKQSDGRYRAKITIGTRLDGTPIYKYVTGRTQRELEDAKRAARSYYVDGQERAKDQLFCEYAIQWYRAHKEPKISISSQNDYNAVYANHLLPAFSGRMLRAIKPLELQLWLNTFEGKSKTRITLAMTILRGIFGSACNDQILEHDPSSHLVKPNATPPNKKRAFSNEERTKIKALFTDHPEGLMLATFYYLGLRRGEVLALQWGDFDWSNGVVHITKDVDFQISRSDDPNSIGDVKSEAAQRDVIIPDQLTTLLYPHRCLPNVYIFKDGNGQTLSKSSFENKWISLMLPLGYTIERENPKAHPDLRLKFKATITPHYFRHNYITMLHEAGVDPVIAMRLVGHADYRTTVNIYTHLNNMHQMSAKEKIDAVFSEKKVAEKLPGKYVQFSKQKISPRKL